MVPATAPQTRCADCGCETWPCNSCGVPVCKCDSQRTAFLKGQFGPDPDSRLKWRRHHYPDGTVS